MPARPSPCPSRISTLQNHPAPATQNGLRNVTRAIPRFSALGCLCIGFKKHTFCSSISMTMPRTKPPVISDIDRSPRSRIHTSEGHRTENHREVYHRAFARTVLENHDPHDPSRRSTIGFSYGFPPKKHLFLSDSGKVRSCFWPKKNRKKGRSSRNLTPSHCLLTIADSSHVFGVSPAQRMNNWWVGKTRLPWKQLPCGDGRDGLQPIKMVIFWIYTLW